MDDAEGRPGRPEGEAVSLRTLVLLLAGVAAAVAAVVAGAAPAHGEHARRLGAELAVLTGDVRRLAAAIESPERLAGVRARVAGSLASLPLLVREAGGDAASLRTAQIAFRQHDWSALVAALELLRQRHPFDVSNLLPATPAPTRLALGAAIHREACAGCHDAREDSRAALPARDLYRMAVELPADEFAARLVNGVRGTPATALANPFGDHEIAALIAHYVHGGAPATAEGGARAKRLMENRGRPAPSPRSG